MGLTYAAILNVNDDTDANLLLDLPELRTKMKKRRRRQAQKLKRLHKQLTAERKDHYEKLALKTLVSTISAGS